MGGRSRRDFGLLPYRSCAAGKPFMRFRAVTAALLLTFAAGTSAALAQSPGIIPTPKEEKGSHAMKGTED